MIFMIASGKRVAEFIPLLSLYVFAAYRTIPALNRLFNSTTSVYYNMAIVDKIYEDMIEASSPEFPLNNVDRKP